MCTIPGWVFGLVFVLFPNQVWHFYRWLLGPDFERRNPHPKQTRNAGIVCLARTEAFPAQPYEKMRVTGHVQSFAAC